MFQSMQKPIIIILLIIIIILLDIAYNIFLIKNKLCNEGKSIIQFDKNLYKKINKFVLSEEKISAATLQRKFKIGYARTAQILDKLEEDGIIGEQEGIKPRKVLKNK